MYVHKLALAATFDVVLPALAQEGAWRAEVLFESEHGMGGAAWRP